MMDAVSASVAEDLRFRPRISVVISTYQRRELVLHTVRTLANQEYDADFEVVVVVDGSTDGTGDALRALATPFPMIVLEQENRGLPASRNTGGHAASGEILLYLDDDMEAHPRLLAEHDRSHRGGAEVVAGPIPLHPDSPANLLGRWVKTWVEGRTARLAVSGAPLSAMDIGGRFSVWRASFLAVGGFDTRMLRGGDLEFAYRVLLRGGRAEFNHRAISWQRYVVDPRLFLEQWRTSGRTDVLVARKHPEVGRFVVSAECTTWHYRLISRVSLLGDLLRFAGLALIERGYMGWLADRLFFACQSVAYCLGADEAGGVPRRRPLRVLAYHAVEDTGGAGPLEPYGVEPEEFRRQMLSLLQAGYHFVSPQEVLCFLRGSGGLPRSPVLLTFDDCYSSVLENALPVLEELGIPAVAFAVTRRVGDLNEWDRWLGAPELPLLDVAGLRRLALAGVEIGAHSRTHPQLTRVSTEALDAEVSGCCDDLRVMGFGPVRFFAYPHGESNAAVRRAVEEVGCHAAFSVEPGLVHPGADRYRIPRIEILRGDTGWRFRWKVAVAGPLLPPGHSWPSLIGAGWKRWGGPLIRTLYRGMLPKPVRVRINRFPRRRKRRVPQRAA